MTPTPDYGAEVTANETTRLMGKLSVLSDADKETVYEQGQALLKNQEQVEDVSCLPTLKVDDISKKTKTVSLEHSAVSSVPVQWRPTLTNGITYFRGISIIPGLTPELKQYLPLFTDVSSGSRLLVCAFAMTKSATETMLTSLVLPCVNIHSL